MRALLLLVTLLACTTPAFAQSKMDPGRLAADKLLIVDCLLPGEVRQLGTRMTYLSPRRAMKTSVGDCEVKGGEYVARVGGNFSTAIAMWLPQAERGDKEAQTYVGELYERGLGSTPPDYGAAATWYRKAADQGFARAMIDLGFLYEKGLGVSKDPTTALNLYRKASGLEGLITVEQSNAIAAARDAEIQQLRRELSETRAALDNARKELERRKGAAASQVEQLEKQKQQAANAGNLDLVHRLEAQLKAREDELNEQRQAVARLEQATAKFREQLAASSSESAALRDELEQMRRQQSVSTKDLDARRQKATELERALESTRGELARAKSQQATSEAQEARIRTLEAQLQARSDDLARQSREIARSEDEAKRYKEQVGVLEARIKQSIAAAEAPAIQLLDPPVVLTRNNSTIKVGTGVSSRDIVGKVVAPAGLLSLSVNDHAQVIDENGLFKISVPVSAPGTPVNIVAVDRRGTRTALQFSLVPEPAVDQLKSLVATVDFGRYYALVIGNQKYQKLPTLDTAVEDARSVAQVLESRYGFKVTKLENATRYQILSELNRMRAQLTDKDNLLIYYAGHGELDRANLRGHWLPIDAEPDSDANWISSVAITDILNAMSVKHALVVADSCYSGAMTRSGIPQLQVGMEDEKRATWIKALAKARSRTVLTSGGIQPVMDGGGGKHSVFAQSFLAVLQENQDLIEGERLYHEVAQRVLDKASRFGVDQQPEYAQLRLAGHEAGDFLFVPKVTVATR